MIKEWNLINLLQSFGIVLKKGRKPSKFLNFLNSTNEEKHWIERNFQKRIIKYWEIVLFSDLK